MSIRKEEPPMLEANFDVPIFKTIKETAKAANLSKYFIRQLLLQKKIRFVKSGTKFLINYASLLEYLNAGETAEKIVEEVK